VFLGGGVKIGMDFQYKYSIFYPHYLIKIGLFTLLERVFDKIRYDLILNKKHNIFLPKSLGK